MEINISVCVYLLSLQKHLIMLKTCIYSGVQFEPKRRDQVYASSDIRRKKWNEEAARIREKENDHLKLLRKNFQVLEGLNIKKDEQKLVNKDWLMKQGYTVDAVSRLVTYENTICSSVFGYVMLKSDDGKSYTFINTSSK